MIKTLGESKKQRAVILSFLIFASAMFVYGVYALYFEYIKWANLTLIGLYTLLAALSVFALGFLIARTDKAHPKGILRSCICGAAAIFTQQAVLWGVTYLINIVLYKNDGNKKAIKVAISLLVMMFAILCGLLLWHLSTFDKKLPYRLSAGAFAAISVGALAGGVVFFNPVSIKDRELKKHAQAVLDVSSADYSFTPLSAKGLNVTKEEKDRCRAWFEENILLAGTNGKAPAYDFTAGGKSLHDTYAEWTFAKAALKVSPEGSETTVITLSNKKTALSARVEATLYPEKATCEWAVYINNPGSEKSSDITDFYAFNGSVETGGDTAAYYSKGSSNRADDFNLFKIDNLAGELYFCGTNGRSSDAYMPYFNFSGKNGGCVLAIGWTGQWFSSVSETDTAVNMAVRQETFDAYLLPGEEVRSPLVSLTFYNSANALKGFNMFRGWITDCVYPDGVGALNMLEFAGPFSKLTSAEIMAEAEKLDKSVLDSTDYFWMDAGWYTYTENWSDGVGSWTVDKSRYTNGISELSEYGKKKDIGLVLWYEPERVREDTVLYNVGLEHPQWLVEVSSDTYMWNLADDEACKYLSEYISSSLKENGISVYRQDFNFTPLDSWKTADRHYYDGRKGICENHYVTNLYKYLDYLTDSIDGLLIDNCASGGRRLDLEMTRRSIPLWRSDYNCERSSDILEATQAQTYGLSFWLPISGTINYPDSEYSARTSIYPCVINTFSSVASEFYRDYSAMLDMQKGAYFPLTTGTRDTDKFLAMQYSNYDGKSGEALIYKRADVSQKEFTVVLNGLIPEVSYSLYDYDAPETVYTKTGSELMSEGITLKIEDAPKAVILLFSAVE